MKTIYKPFFENEDSFSLGVKKFLNSPDNIVIWDTRYSDGYERRVAELDGIIRNSMQLNHVLADAGSKFTLFVFLRKDDEKILQQLEKMGRKFIIIPSDPKNAMFKKFPKFSA